MDTITDLPGYRITEQLYAGSRTLVYRGVRESDPTSVVIKVLRNEYPSFTELVQFRNQYTIAKNLNLPSIVKPLDLAPYKNAYALIMEDFGGVSLSTYLKAATDQNQPDKSISLENFLNKALQLAEILHYLYQNRVIHKDIKPANILINPESKQIKLIDFSISSLLPKQTQEIQNPNILEGTLAYLSPEQTGRMNRGIDYRSDFYPLGVTFYELLAKQLPFRSEDPMELVHYHLAKDPIPVHQVKPEIPLVLSQIVSKLMAKNAENRYQSALGMKHDLENCLAQLQETGKIETFALGTRDITDCFLIPEKLYGRQTEVDNLLAAFERVSAGRTEMMLVAGFSGIGKTAVVNEVHKPIVRQRGYFIKGKYDQFQRNIPFSAFVQAFRDLMGQLLSESDIQLHKWKTQILEAVGNNGKVLIEVIPELEQLIGKQLPAPELSGRAAQNRFNLLMQKFVQVFTCVEHPLVLFLDDLQWADSASLKLMKLLVHDTRHLLVIGAYRDNEVSPVHPLMLTLDEIGRTGATVHTITLEPLSLIDMNQLVADTLNCGNPIAQPLTELVYKKTKGNPFFATQFLKSLHEDGQVTFDCEVRHWQCDIAQIKALAITDDVVEFMALQLQKLPAKTQTMLKLAACMGAQFNLNTLALVSEQSQIETAADLWKALQEGLVLPVSEVYKFYQIEAELTAQPSAFPTQNCSYRFLHDRVQQAAYFLIPEAQKSAIHLKIGRSLLNHTHPELRDDFIFEIVNQFNLGIELITTPSKRDELAQFNSIAGQKAKLSTAYEPAARYLTTGLGLLAVDCWQRQYDLTLELHIEAAEAEYLRGNFERSTALADVALTNAKTLLDRVKVYELQMQICISRLQMVQAVEIGLQVLEKLGTTLLPMNDDSSLVVELTDSKNLDGLPVMTDPNKLAVMRILNILCAPVFMAKPEIFPQIIITMIHLCLKQGNSSLSCFAYGFYGLLLVGLGKLEPGYQAGIIALNLLEKFKARELKAKVYNLFNSNIRSWKEHARNSVAPLQEAVQGGLESGDLEWGGYCAANLCSYLFFTESNLENAIEQQGTYIDLCIQIKQEIPTHFSQIWRQLAQNFQGHVAGPLLLVGESFDESQILPRMVEAKSGTVLFMFYVAKTILTYHLQDYAQTLQNVALANEQMGAALGFMQVVILNFYHSLGLLRHYPQANTAQQQHYLEQVQANQKQMQFWAHHAPMNHQHRFDLVEAEKAMVLGQSWLAIDHYDRAIQQAKQNEYLNEEALANELAAKFYLDWGKEKVAASYMQEAYYCYARWGALAKVRDLEKRYPQLLQSITKRETVSISSTQPSTSTTMTDTNILDFATVMKASQVLAGEIVLDKLLAKLLKIVLENAGASSGFLILDRGSELWIEAAGQLELYQVFVPQMVSVQNSLLVPLSIINYVAQSQQDVVLDDARISENFLNDSYIKLHQPKSVLCTTIQVQGQLIGLVYLENNLTTGAFTPNRLSVVRLLCSLAAISLKNAQLYDQLGEYSRTLERKVMERTQELQQEIAIRMQTEIALVQSEEKFSKAFRSSPNPIAIARLADGRYIEVNDSFLSTFSYSRQEVIGFTPIELNLWVNLEECGRYRQLLQESGILRNQEFDCRTSSGEVRKMLVSADIIDLGGEACILLVTNDITARKRVEEALKESEAKYRDLVETSQDMIWSLDTHGRYTFVNAAVKQIFGYCPEEMIGRKFSDFKPPEQLPKDNDIFQRTLNGESVFQYETIHLAKDSRPINLRVNAIVVRDSEGNVLGITGTASDITESKKAEEALQQAKEVADTANKAKSEFLSKMSHELRTPLNAILGFTQVLARDSSLSHIQQEQIGIISRSGEHLLALINDVLEMSKIEAGRITLNPTSFDLYHLLNSLEEMLKLKADSKGLQLSLHLNSNIPQYVKTDESKLRQVLINLLGNAIKFTSKGSVTLRVAAISAKQKSPTDNEPRTITFKVEDTGHGIAPTEVDSLFEAFVQSDAGRKSQEGTGLGLPISRQFVQLMGGDIAVSSTLNRGTIFSFDIQISSPEMAEVQPRQSRKRVIGLEPNQPSYRILVVDDKWESRLLLVHLLEPLGLEVREAVNGQEAIRIWETWKPHLIWMDMQMPVIDGYEATRQIKALIQEEATPIVALTASAFEEERAIVLSSGCDDFVSKPFQEEVIFAKMAEHLGVQYIYEDLPNFTLSQLEGQDLSVKAGEETELLRTNLVAMPAEWVIQLHQAAIDADAELILSLVAVISESNTSFAETIADWANNFRFDKITNLTEEMIP